MIDFILSLLTIGNLACLFQLGLIVDGMRDQIKINGQRRSTEGLSVRKQYWTLAASTLWAVTGLYDHNYYMVPPQIICILLTLLTIGQIHYYNRK